MSYGGNGPNGYSRMVVQAEPTAVAQLSRELGVETQAVLGYLTLRALEHNLPDAAVENGGLQAVIGDGELKEFQTVASGLNAHPELLKLANSQLRHTTSH